MEPYFRSYCVLEPELKFLNWYKSYLCQSGGTFGSNPKVLNHQLAFLRCENDDRTWWKQKKNVWNTFSEKFHWFMIIFWALHELLGPLPWKEIYYNELGFHNILWQLLLNLVIYKIFVKNSQKIFLPIHYFVWINRKVRLAGGRLKF